MIRFKSGYSWCNSVKYELDDGSLLWSCDWREDIGVYLVDAFTAYKPVYDGKNQIVGFEKIALRWGGV